MDDATKHSIIKLAQQIKGDKPSLASIFRPITKRIGTKAPARPAVRPDYGPTGAALTAAPQRYFGQGLVEVIQKPGRNLMDLWRNRASLQKMHADPEYQKYEAMQSPRKRQNTGQRAMYNLIVNPGYVKGRMFSGKRGQFLRSLGTIATPMLPAPAIQALKHVGSGALGLSAALGARRAGRYAGTTVGEASRYGIKPKDALIPVLDNIRSFLPRSPFADNDKNNNLDDAIRYGAYQQLAKPSGKDPSTLQTIRKATKIPMAATLEDIRGGLASKFKNKAFESIMKIRPNDIKHSKTIKRLVTSYKANPESYERVTVFALDRLLKHNGIDPKKAIKNIKEIATSPYILAIRDNPEALLGVAKQAGKMGAVGLQGALLSMLPGRSSAAQSFKPFMPGTQLASLGSAMLPATALLTGGSNTEKAKALVGRMNDAINARSGGVPATYGNNNAYYHKPDFDAPGDIMLPYTRETGSPGIHAHETGHSSFLKDRPELLDAYGLSKIVNQVGGTLSKNLGSFDVAAGSLPHRVLAAASAAGATPMVAEEVRASVAGYMKADALAKTAPTPKERLHWHLEKFRAFSGLPTYIRSAIEPVVKAEAAAKARKARKGE